MALTGGIATGKSTAARRLQELIPGMVFFDCDVEVRRLLEGDERIREEIALRFGRGALDATGKVSRAFLRERVFSDECARQSLEAVLHPRVREECLAAVRQAAKSGAGLFIADVPLLFEKGFEFGQEKVLLVASTRSTQIDRLKARNGHEDSLISSILAAQWPIEEKIPLADVVFWNEGPPAILHSQLERFSQALP